MKLIDGSQVDIPLDNPVIAAHFNDPYNYTREIMAQFEDEYYKGIIPWKMDTLLDIGGNVGLFSLHVHPMAGKIICVEPTPTHMEKQRILLKDVGVIHEQAALAGRTGRTTFYWCGINTTMNSLQNRGDRSFEVECYTLQDLLDKHKLDKVDFCKIDIEGSEHEAITAETLKPVANKFKRIFIELHPPDGATQDKFQAIFEECGFRVKKYVHDSLICDYAK